MIPWHTRLKARLSELRMTSVELARLTGIPEASIYKYVSGRTSHPRGDVLTKLSAALRVTEQWLAYGGPSEAAGGNPQVGVRVIPVVKVLELPAALGRAEVISMLENVDPTLPVPDTVASGAFGILLSDDAMNLAPSGATAVVDPDSPSVPGKLVAAMSTALGYAVVRRWRATNLNGGGDLVADHPDFPVVPLRSAADGYVLGRVVSVLIPC